MTVCECLVTLEMPVCRINKDASKGHCGFVSCCVIGASWSGDSPLGSLCSSQLEEVECP